MLVLESGGVNGLRRECEAVKGDIRVSGHYRISRKEAESSW